MMPEHSSNYEQIITQTFMSMSTSFKFMFKTCKFIQPVDYSVASRLSNIRTPFQLLANPHFPLYYITNIAEKFL